MLFLTSSTCVQAIQLLHRSVEQLAYPNDDHVVGTMISMLPNDTIMGIMASCVRLPIYSFATPKTRFGASRQCTASAPLQVTCASPAPDCLEPFRIASGWVAMLQTCCTVPRSREGGHAADARPLAAG